MIGSVVDEAAAMSAAACLFRALGDSSRLAILRHLAPGEHRVVDLTAHLGLAQSTVSKHLSCLRDCGLVAAGAGLGVLVDRAGACTGGPRPAGSAYPARGDQMHWTGWLSLGAGALGGPLLLWTGLVVALWTPRPNDLRIRDALRLLPDLIRMLRGLATDPDVIPVLGYADDAIVVALALRSVARRVGPQAWNDTGQEPPTGSKPSAPWPASPPPEPPSATLQTLAPTVQAPG